MRNKTINPDGDPEFGVDSRYTSSMEKEQDSIDLMQARLERMKNLTREEIIRAKLLQLKLKMEEYLKNPDYDNQKHFARFLETYIDIIYTKRNVFAVDLSISPNYLSKIINNHREPNEEFILKLMIHSEKVFKNITHFRKKTWYQIFYQEKLNATMASQDTWRPKIEKEINFKSLNSPF